MRELGSPPGLPQDCASPSLPSPLAAKSGSANSAGIPASHDVNCLRSELLAGLNRRSLRVCLQASPGSNKLASQSAKWGREAFPELAFPGMLADVPPRSP